MTSLIRSTMTPTRTGRFFDDFFTRDLLDWATNNFSTTETTIPAVNIRETEDNFLVEMAAPGMTKEDFQVELDNDLLTIRSEHREESKDGEEGYLRREFSYQSFERSFRLNKQVVDEDQIKAGYEDGMLKLIIPKTEEAKKASLRRRIEIN